MARTGKTDVRSFVKDWAGRGDEQKDSTTFWTDLFNRCFGITPAEITAGYAKFEHQVKGMTPAGKVNTRRADVLIPDHRVLIEQKSIGVDLDKPRDNGVWGRETPFQQARWYANNLPFTLRPRWIVICNFESFRIYDLDQDVPELEYVEIALSDLPRQLGLFQFMHSESTSKLVQEKALSVEAGNRVARLYDALAGCYHHIDTSADEQRSLNILITRLVFLLYAEDADLLQTRTAFGDYCQGNPASLRERLVRLFETVDTPYDQRDEYLDPRVAEFPYIDGGLFEDRNVIVPQLSGEVAATIAEVSQEFDWAGISPTIFGAVFESTLNPETRRAGGMHYTSVENIHKVIGPLFLDELTDELERAEALVTVKARERALNRLHDKIAGLRFLDPACGSGNFLTETYLQLRRLENRILEAKAGDGQTMLTTEGLIRVSLDQLYGIEINDFAVAVAKTALWISESQMLDETQSLFPLLDLDFLPLTSNEHIVQGNALRMDWNEVLSASRCSYVMGNPPFKGAHASEMPRSPEQTADLIHAFDGMRGISEVDYVAAWFAVASKYVKGSSTSVGFVATNSIGQGQQPSLIWPYLWENGVKIHFSYHPFLWGNETADQAAVAVTIVGLTTDENAARTYFETDYRTGVIVASHNVENISPYLMPGPDNFVGDRQKPLCDVPAMKIGSQPIDGGHYVFKADEMREFIKLEPGSARYMHEYLGSAEFLNNRKRYVLWLGEASESDLESLPLCRERVEKVRAFRLSSNRASTKRAADTPQHFGTEIISTTNSIAVPEVSSRRRYYIPMGFISPDVFCSNKLRLIPDADIYMFGVLQSQFHNAWMRAVAGRLKQDYSYSSGVVYNNYVWPDPTTEQRHAIEVCAKAVIDARNAHDGDSLAEMYDGISPIPNDVALSERRKYDQRKYDDLRAAHEALDAAVEAAYGVDFGGDEERIVAHLFRLYDEATRNQ